MQIPVFLDLRVPAIERCRLPARNPRRETAVIYARNPRRETAVIYALSDPRSPNQYRYIGSTGNLQKRIAVHETNGRRFQRGLDNSMVSNWIAMLQRNGLKPTVITLVTVNVKDRFEAEAKLITEYSAISGLMQDYHTR